MGVFFFGGGGTHQQYAKSVSLENMVPWATANVTPN